MDAYIFKRKWNDICIGGFTRRSWYDSRVLVVIPLLSGGWLGLKVAAVEPEYYVPLLSLVHTVEREMVYKAASISI